MNRYAIALCATLATAPAYARATNSECVTQDGSRFFMSASKGGVMVRWEGTTWYEAFGKVEGDMVVVTQILPNGVIIFAWDTSTNAAHVVMKNDRTGERTEARARCWFK